MRLRVPLRAWVRGLVGVALLALGAASTVRAQGVTRLDADLYRVTYRPPSASYRVLSSSHFDLIYQVGEEEAALSIQQALEHTLAGTDSLVGLTPGRFRMPVVVDGFSDRSNGFVTPFPFKQEIEAPSIRRDPLVARASSWPALVATHELVHALHGDINVGFGFGDVVRFFAPDAARATNLTAPRGLVEGIAVYRESQFEGDAGRLHAPLFQMKMRAAMLADDPWSLTQMMEPPRYTQPFNRFYIGGAHAFQHWARRGDTTDTAFFQEAASLHNKVPFLGFGVGLWHGLGDPPDDLEEELHTTLRTRYQSALDRLRPFTERTTLAGRRGHNYRRPYWLSDSTLVTYLHGYDVRAGFYRVNAATGAREQIRVQSITEDYTYSLGPDSTTLLASRYVPDPWVPTQERAEVERIDLQDGSATRLTHGGRVFAPVETRRGAVWAIQNDGSFTQWAVVEEGAASAITQKSRTRFRQLAVSPDGGTTAVLVNVDGTQRVYRASAQSERPPRLQPWFGLQDAIIYDLSWGPRGRYLLFAADRTGIANVFAFDTATDRVLQLTNVPFGALEPALSPDRSTLAFVDYQHERHELVRTPFRPDDASIVDPSRVLRGAPSALPIPTHAETDSTVSIAGRSRPYQAWRHLAPRMVVPTVRYDADEADLPDAARFEKLGVGVGLGIAGNDPLQRWMYRGDAYWQDGRLWGEAAVRSGRWRLRPSLTLFNTPDTVPATIPTDTGRREARIGFEERGVSLGTRLPITLQSNVYQSSAVAAVSAQFRQTRFFGATAEALERSGASGLTDWSDRLTLFPQAAWGHRLQQNPRDLVPNQGIILRSFAELDAWTDGASASRAWVTEADLYLPLALRSHTGVRLGAGLLTQNAGAILSLDQFVPRGYENAFLGSGTFLRLGTEITQPLWYVDDGWTLVPVYVNALYSYGFAQTLMPLHASGSLRSSIGGGVGLQLRFFYVLDLSLQFGLAYRLEPGDVEGVYR
jgi:hypothetical protein